MATKETTFMRDPPPGEERWAAGTNITAQQAVGAATFAFATLIYGLRLFARLSIAKIQLRTDDYLSGAALLSCWCFYGCTMGMIAYGGCARHFWQVTTAEYETLLKWTVPVNIFYMLSSDLAKISLLFLYLRISPDRKFHIVVKTLVATFAMYAIIYAMISIFGCRPINASWDLEVMESGKCVDKPSFFLAASIANIVMDLVILIIPIPIVIPLQIPRQQKISLLLLFATGGFVIVVAIYNSILTVNLFMSDNYTWGLSYELSWMYAELSACVICASASSLKPIFMRFIPGFFSSRFGYSGHSGAGGTEGTRKIRKQRSRRQGDAIELESDTESGRKVCEDDEVKLWSQPTFLKRGNDCALTKVQVTAQGGKFPETHLDADHPNWADGSPPAEPTAPRQNLAINVVHTAEVTYSPVEHPSMGR